MALVTKAELIESARTGRFVIFKMDPSKFETGRAYIYRVAREIGYKWKVKLLDDGLLAYPLGGQKPYIAPPPPAPKIDPHHALLQRLAVLRIDTADTFPDEMVPTNVRALARARGIEVDLLRYGGIVVIARRNGRL